MKITKRTIENFRSDFDKATADLQKKYGVKLSIGTIRYDDTEFRGKLTATLSNGEEEITLKATDFKVGDKVGIKHSKVDEGKVWTVTKVNRVNIKVKNGVVVYTVSPSFLFKV